MEKWNTFITNLFSVKGEELTIVGYLLKISAAIIVTILIFLIIKILFKSLDKKAAKRRGEEPGTSIFPAIRQALNYIIFYLLGFYLINIFNINFIAGPFQALIIILLALPVKKIAITGVEFFKSALAKKTETKVDDIIFDLFNRFAGVLIFATAIIISLDVLGINIVPFIAGAGVAGIAIGFAAKDTLSNLIAGVLLIIDRPFEIGDRIEVWSAPAGSATWGDVIDIGIRATKIKTTDNIIIIIPNNEIMTRDIVNYTIISNQIRVRVNIGVAYDTDIDKAKEIIIGVAETAEWISTDPPPKVVVRNFGESSVDLQLRVWIKNARKRMDTISHITDNVKSAFDKSGIEIPYPKRDIVITHKNIT
ncbi:MAG: mechanosensitive ion channel family protein [Desulfobacterales bacterium]|nr:mechanosensitive ion channel family protein [Desulfobacterales bacterium]